MTHPHASTNPPSAPGPFIGATLEARIAIAVIGVMTVLRLLLVLNANHLLAPDEALYWSWGTEPAFGYFAKPPMVAWIMAGSTAIFGNVEPGVRVTSPLFHAATALTLFAVARRLYDDRVAMWSAVVYATAPAVSFSSGVMTTDVPLLFFWTFGLLALIELLRTRSLAWAAALGLILGFGILSKYAMFYFIGCAALFLALSPNDRWLLRSGRLLLALAIAGLIFLPNLLWNADNGFATIGHTAANTNLGGELFRFDKFLEFLGGQFGVFGPLVFVAFVARIANLKRGDLDRPTLFLVSFSLPIILLLCVQAFLSRAHANWAVPAYVAATVLVSAWLLQDVRRRWRWVLPTSVGLHVLAGLMLAILVMRPDAAARVGLGEMTDPIRGWDRIGDRVAAVVAEGLDGRPYTAVMTNDSKLHGEVLFYAQGRLPRHPGTDKPAHVMWDYDGVPQNHYELTVPLKDPKLGERVLFVARFGPSAHAEILDRFSETRLIEVLDIASAGRRYRPLYLYALEGFLGREDPSDP